MKNGANTTPCVYVPINENSESFSRIALVVQQRNPNLLDVMQPPSGKDQLFVEQKQWALVQRNDKLCYCQLTKAQLNFANNTWLVQNPAAQAPSDTDCPTQNYILYNHDATRRLDLQSAEDGSMTFKLAPAIPLPSAATVIRENPNATTRVTFVPTK